MLPKRRFGVSSSDSARLVLNGQVFDGSDLELGRSVPLSDLTQSVSHMMTAGYYNLFIRNIREVRYGVICSIEIK